MATERQSSSLSERRWRRLPWFEIVFCVVLVCGMALIVLLNGVGSVR